MTTKAEKPLKKRAYGSIPHIPESQLGPGDHHIDEGCFRIMTQRLRSSRDWVCCEEKLDGTCVAVVRIGSEIVPLIRAGYRCVDSPHEQHHLFDSWVRQPENMRRFSRLLNDGERLCGEWLAQACGTKYELQHEPFVAFDLMRGDERALRSEFWSRVLAYEFVTPRVLDSGGPICWPDMLANLCTSGHGAEGRPEGCVFRLENGSKVEWLAKWVRPGHVVGRYLPEISGFDPVWNWRPA